MIARFVTSIPIHRRPSFCAAAPARPPNAGPSPSICEGWNGGTAPTAKPQQNHITQELTPRPHHDHTTVSGESNSGGRTRRTGCHAPIFLLVNATRQVRPYCGNCAHRVDTAPGEPRTPRDESASRHAPPCVVSRVGFSVSQTSSAWASAVRRTRPTWRFVVPRYRPSSACDPRRTRRRVSRRTSGRSAPGPVSRGSHGDLPTRRLVRGRSAEVQAACCWPGPPR